MPLTGKTTEISDEAVEKATGRNWKAWFSILDKGGAAKMEHKAIALLLHTKHKVPSWWCQMVTVEYERARGLRQKHQKADGYSASVSRTLPVSLSGLYAAFAKSLDLKTFTVRKATQNKSMRITAHEANGGDTSVEVNFYAKGEAKSQVAVECNKLPNARSVAAKKAYWSEVLDRLYSEGAKGA